MGIKSIVRRTLCTSLVALCALSAQAQEVKEPNVAGSFYPASPGILAGMVDNLIAQAHPSKLDGDIGLIIVPHAGYEYSGATAALAYRAIQGRPYKTVVVIAPAHYFPFSGVSVYRFGYFRTPLGDIEVDAELAGSLLAGGGDIVYEPQAFQKEHALEVQLPFLQRALAGFKLVPVIVGDVQLPALDHLGRRLREVIGDRNDVLVVLSTDLYHGYDFSQAPEYDRGKLDYMLNGDAEGLYRSLKIEGSSPRMCGGFAVVAGLTYARLAGYTVVSLGATTSAEVTGRKVKGEWSVGYAALAAVKKDEADMFTNAQRRRLLEIARSSMEHYVKTGRRLEVRETDPLLNEQMGAFVTLHTGSGDLRGCIGHMIGDQPLYLTVRDMAVEAAVHDPRFSAVTSDELSGIGMEISVLTPMRKIASADEIEMGKHGVMIRRGLHSGVYLPQVARDTGWSTEQFLNSLCAQKAGLPADAWRDPSTDIYVYTAEVFSEQEP